MSKILICVIIYIMGLIISSIAQVLLKKSADTKKDSIIKEYLNWRTILSYSIFFLATLCTVFSYKYIPLSFGPILGTLEYLFVAILSYIFLKEKIKKKKLLGFIIILLGVIIYSI